MTAFSRDESPSEVPGVMPLSGRRKALVALVIVVVIMFAHGLVIARLFSEEKPFRKYPLAVEKYLKGGLGPERLLDYSPLYFHFQAAVHRLSEKPLVLVQAIQSAMVALSGALLFMMLSRAFPLPLALLGVAAFSFNYSVMIYEKVMEPECMLMFLLAAFLFFAGRERKINAFIAGVFFGLSFLTRANFIVLTPLVPLYYFVNRTSLRSWERRSGLFLLPVAAAVILLWARNFNETGKFVPFAANPGQVFYEGNNPNSQGKSAEYPPLVNDLAVNVAGEVDYQHAIYRLLADKSEGKDLSIVETNRFWQRKALNFISDHPLHFSKMLLLKARLFFHDYRRHDLPQARRLERRLEGSAVPSFPFWVISALAVVGMAVAWKGWRRDMLFYAVLLIQFVVLVLIYVTDRQRIAVLPVFIYFAIRGVSVLGQDLKKISALIAAVALSYFIVGADIDIARKERFLLDSGEEVHRNAAQMRFQRDERNFEAAKKYAARNFALAPMEDVIARPSGLFFPAASYTDLALAETAAMKRTDPYARFDLALLHLHAGNLDTAEGILKELSGEGRKFYQGFTNSSEPDYYLGRIEEMRGDKEKALLRFGSALRKAPGSPFELSHLFALTGDVRYREAIKRYFDDIDAAYLVGKALVTVGKFKEAVPYLTHVVATVPEYRNGLIYLAVSLAASGDNGEAAELYVRSMRLASEPVLFEEKVTSIFRKLAEDNPDNALFRYFYSDVLRQFGL